MCESTGKGFIRSRKGFKSSKIHIPNIPRAFHSQTSKEVRITTPFLDLGEADGKKLFCSRLLKKQWQRWHHYLPEYLSFPSKHLGSPSEVFILQTQSINIFKNNHSAFTGINGIIKGINSTIQSINSQNKPKFRFPLCFSRLG